MRRKKSKEDARIDRSFRRGERSAVMTVGELITELQQLPSDLNVCGECDQGVKVSVTNWNDEFLALQIRNADD